MVSVVTGRVPVTQGLRAWPVTSALTLPSMERTVMKSAAVCMVCVTTVLAVQVFAEQVPVLMDFQVNFVTRRWLRATQTV